ncbi:hypothetical protein CTI12_AA133230 [Artemisia annua]|uniref:DUF659 domain-containing protein n=1 Tax=Artemisia annua TaxID=35608 RepID=A0A2U1NAX8_ARTAN|nr:hypothetical protein CTI12_AA133230 [Artemisia annua]
MEVRFLTMLVYLSPHGSAVFDNARLLVTAWKEGTTFLSSVECSLKSHIGEFIFDFVDKGIEDVGPQNVVQVVIDNATNNMVVAQLLGHAPWIFTNTSSFL